MSITPDYPDWIRVDQWVGAPIIRGNQPNVASPQVFGPFFVAPWEQVAFTVQQSAGAAVAYLLTVDFLDGMTGNIVNTVIYGAQASMTISDFVATQSLYVRFTITFLGGGVRTFNVLAVPRRGVHPASRLFGQQGLLTMFGVAVAAGGTFTTLLNPVCACAAVFSVATSAAAWTAELREQDSIGATLANIASMGTFPGRGVPTQNVNLPPNPVLFTFSNGDGVGRTVDAGVFALRG